MSHHNHRHSFPNLRAVRLESFAHNWAEEFTFIKRISLYRKPVDSDFDFRVKYVMHFEISDISKTKGYGELGGYREDDKLLFEALIEADKSWIESLESPNGLDLISALATTENDFKEVYKHNPKDNFIDEWRFVTKLPKKIVEEYSWILFSHTDKERTTEQVLQGFQPEVIDLMNEARPEIESIYKAIKEGEGFKNIGEKYVEARRKDALNYFEEYIDKFNIIKKEDLYVKKIFATSPAKYDRKIKGELLRTVVKRCDLGSYSYGKLFDQYQKQKNN